MVKYLNSIGDNKICISEIEGVEEVIDTRTDGSYNTISREIHIQEDLPENLTMKTLRHELSHAYHLQNNLEPPDSVFTLPPLMIESYEDRKYIHPGWETRFESFAISASVPSDALLLFDDFPCEESISNKAVSWVLENAFPTARSTYPDEMTGVWSEMGKIEHSIDLQKIKNIHVEFNESNTAVITIEGIDDRLWTLEADLLDKEAPARRWDITKNTGVIQTSVPSWVHHRASRVAAGGVLGTNSVGLFTLKLPMGSLRKYFIKSEAGWSPVDVCIKNTKSPGFIVDFFYASDRLNSLHVEDGAIIWGQFDF